MGKRKRVLESAAVKQQSVVLRGIYLAPNLLRTEDGVYHALHLVRDVLSDVQDGDEVVVTVSVQVVGDVSE